MDFVKTMVGGRVVSSPVFKNFNGVKVVSFDLACHEGYHTEFYSVEAYGRTAEFINSAIKNGERVLIEGHIHQQRVREEGKVTNKVIIVAHNLYILR